MISKEYTKTEYDLRDYGVFDRKYELYVDSAYIITLKDNKISETLSKRCQESCEQVGMPYKVWDAVDGTSGNIVIPEKIKDKDWLSWINITDKYLSLTEAAAALSHISLWAHCATIQKPIVILEHDAIMVRPYLNHICSNTIGYLGCKIQKTGQFPIQPSPVHGSSGPNYRFIYKAHAYAIDHIIAKHLLSHIFKFGIHESLDIMIREDVFPIVQPGFFAYEEYEEEQTTIVGRKKDIYGSER